MEQLLTEQDVVIDRNRKIDVTMFLAFVQQTCESIDYLILLFKKQIQRDIK